MNLEEAKWCPQHGYPLPCHKCGMPVYSKSVTKRLAIQASEPFEAGRRAGTRIIIDLLYKWCNVPFNHGDFTEELDALGIDWKK